MTKHTSRRFRSWFQLVVVADLLLCREFIQQVNLQRFVCVLRRIALRLEPFVSILLATMWD